MPSRRQFLAVYIFCVFGFGVRLVFCAVFFLIALIIVNKAVRFGLFLGNLISKATGLSLNNHLSAIIFAIGYQGIVPL